MNEIKTDCEKCNGWYNSCAPDDYPDYIDDPEHCSEFEAKDSDCGCHLCNDFTEHSQDMNYICKTCKEESE
jgi:hypothetical protein